MAFFHTGMKPGECVSELFTETDNMCMVISQSRLSGPELIILDSQKVAILDKK